LSGLKIIERRFSEREVKQSIFDILKHNVLCSMATVNKNGRKAHINTAYFAYSKEPELFFCSYPDSIHCLNLAKNSSMAMTVFNSNQTWGKPDRGIQLFGSCEEAKGHWRKKAEKVYGSRFKEFRNWKREIEKEEGEFTLNLYRFAPHEAKILDEPLFGGGVFVKVHLP
jgi:uncharacterized protein YhbP (UPF0306 family)